MRLAIVYEVRSREGAKMLPKSEAETRDVDKILPLPILWQEPDSFHSTHVKFTASPGREAQSTG